MEKKESSNEKHTTNEWMGHKSAKRTGRKQKLAKDVAMDGAEGKKKRGKEERKKDFVEEVPKRS